jgi:penicillin-binding protein 2
MSIFSEKEYKISVGQDDWVAPEETLVDSSSDHSNLEQPISEGVFRFVLGTIVLLAVVLAGAAFNLSILKHEAFAKLAFQNKTVNFAIAPARGVIMDSQGVPLVKNIPSFDLLAVSRELPRTSDERTGVVGDVANILGQSVEEVQALMDAGMKKSIFFLASDLSKDKIIALKHLDPKGLYVITTTKRAYPDGTQFSTVIGYTGKVSKSDISKDAYYLPSDVIGRSGIESSYETILRGEHGRIFFTKDDEHGTNEEAVPGQNIVLNVGYDIQKALYNALYSEIRPTGLNSAAAIVQNPNTGAVLAMVSLPGFDNNIFNSEVSPENYQRLFESKSRPLFNRVIGGQYNPGSTIKPFIGMAALEEKVVTPRDTIQDCISLMVPNPFNPDQPYIFKNWRADTGPFNMRRAIANSCNVYFFTVGGGFGNITGLGVNKIVNYLKTAFAHKVLGIDMPGETSGFVPTPDWKEETRHEPWYQGDTYNISIGQGDLVVTPLWINSYISAIANGGTMYRPQVVQRLVDQNKNTVKVFEPQELVKLPFSKDVVDEIKADMRETVLSGTSQLLQELPVTSGAKTGTAEVIKGQSINSLFTAFAPFDHPEVVITVLVEGSASNQGYATHTAFNFMKWYFGQTASR